jgi:hypothetical protein
LPKDNENIPFFGPVEPSEPLGFTPQQMIRCEECLRANPPTRTTCLYCVAPLPLTESAAKLRKPDLRQPEKHQLGYNNIILPDDPGPSASIVTDAAKLLKLTEENLQQLLFHKIALPVARTASREEAELVFIRLQDLGIRTITLSDEELGLTGPDGGVKRVRSMTFDDDSLAIHQSGVGEETTVGWSDVVLIVPGRLFETRLEIKERMTRKSENDIVDTSEFFRDESVIDFYLSGYLQTWRVSANGFDFSCLGSDKSLIANENLGKLQRLLSTKAANAQVDDSYSRLRGLLELAWITQPETQSSGWRRERPGKLSVGVATTKSNESQFTRYSRLRHYFHSNPNAVR